MAGSLYGISGPNIAAMTKMHVKTGTTQEEQAGDGGGTEVADACRPSLLLEQVSWRPMGPNGSANRTVRDGYKVSISCVIGLMESEDLRVRARDWIDVASIIP